MLMLGESVTPVVLVLFATLLAALSGVPLLLPFVSPTKGQAISTVLMGFASILGVVGSILTLLGVASPSYSLSWVHSFGEARLQLDALSAVFLFIISLVSGACSLYAKGYWSAQEHPSSVRRLSFFFGLLVASLSMVVMSQNGVLFLFFWEIMSFAAYFCLITEDSKKEVRDAGALYLIVSHISGLALFALFSLLQGPNSSYLFPVANSLSPYSATGTAVFFLALIAFGLKAGLMPFHVWLPSAHANAPSHVSAMLSGVVLKLGVYGVLRTLSFYSQVPSWWGVVLLCLGAISGVLGVAFAIGQHDLKRLLAYHSIENIGIIFMGIGLALIGQSSGNRLMMLFGMAGALLHVVNHATFKALLFLAGGAVIHATDTREIDSMGGLARHLPWSSKFFLLGAVAICGLPPLNGFVSELLIYFGFFQGVIAKTDFISGVSAVGAPALALIGGLALACFVKVYGVVFLGNPRKKLPTTPHEAPGSMLGSMGILATVCLLIGLLPWIAAPLLQRAVIAWRPSAASDLPVDLAKTAHLQVISGAAVALLFFIVLVYLAFAKRLSRLPSASDQTWGCGYTAPTPRMQYTASSFAEMLVAYFRMVLRPRVHPPKVRGVFPEASHFESHVPEATLELVYVPLLQRLYEKTAPIRHLQHGHLNLYILYTFITLIVLMFLIRA